MSGAIRKGCTVYRARMSAETGKPEIEKGTVGYIARGGTIFMAHVPGKNWVRAGSGGPWRATEKDAVAYLWLRKRAELFEARAKVERLRAEMALIERMDIREEEE